MVAGKQPALLPHPLPRSPGQMLPGFPPPPPPRQPPLPAAGTAAILDPAEHPHLRDAQVPSVPASLTAEADEAPTFPALTRHHFHSRWQTAHSGLGRSSARSSPRWVQVCLWGTGTGCLSLLPPGEAFTVGACSRKSIPARGTPWHRAPQGAEYGSGWLSAPRGALGSRHRSGGRLLLLLCLGKTLLLISR